MYTLQVNVPINETTPKTYYGGGKVDHHHHSTLMASSNHPHEAITAVEDCSEPWMKHVSLCSRDLIWEDCETDEEDFMRFPLPTEPGQGLTRSTDACWSTSNSNSNRGSGDRLLGSSSRLDNSASSSATASLESSSRTTASAPLSNMLAALSALPENQIQEMAPPLLSQRPSADRADDASPSASSSSSHNASASHRHQQHHCEQARNIPRFRQDIIRDHADVELYLGDLIDGMPPSDSSVADAVAATARESSMHFTESFMASQREIMSQIEGNRQQQQQQQAARQREPPRQEILDGNGSRVRIHDQERVYAAMDDGTAQILQCIGCSKHMMATNDMDLVFCPACGTLTPLNMAGRGN